MNISMSSLVSDAKELVMRLKEREKNVDQVVIQSNALAKKVDAIQQVSKPSDRSLPIKSSTASLLVRFLARERTGEHQRES